MRTSFDESTTGKRAPLRASAKVAVLFLAGALLWTGCVANVASEGGRITGVVDGRDGPEAGVWVIAETDDLGTRFTKIVVTDDQGRFVLPELPAAAYEVWVRGYGLRDTEPVPARPGHELVLAAAYPDTPQEAAQVYPASYWYSLIEVPARSEFPGAGPEGNGIPAGMATQEDWIDQMKQGCQLCHQLGNEVTRSVAHIANRFETTEDAWRARVTFGQRAGRMNAAMSQFGPRGVEMFADWTDRIAAGEVPPAPPRPEGVERNIVLTMWDWGFPNSYVHDEVATDKRNPAVNSNGPVYGVSMTDDRLLIVDPITHEARDLKIPVRDADTPSYFPLVPGPEPSPFWGDELVMNGPANVHNPMMDHRGRVWLTSNVRAPATTPNWCAAGSGNPYAEYFPLGGGNRQASVYDPATDSFVLVDTCFSTHHLQFAEDEDHTLYFSGDGSVIGWLNTRRFDETGDAGASQGWCPTVIDSNGDGRITRPWNQGPGPRDPALDTRLAGFAYGVIVNPVDGSIWIARTGGVPGTIIRLDPGDSPPESCLSEAYEPPFDNPEVPPGEWGYAPRGMDVTRDGVIWTALSGSSHLASFDRSKCPVLSGPDATGQHCAEGWTLYPAPGPQMKNAGQPGGSDFHYYNWVDQFNTLGLGENIPIANGTTSDALLALDPDSGEWVVMRVPYPLGFYSRGLDGRIDDPDAGWKGRAVWADFGTNTPWHIEGGKGALSRIVKFQIRPDPLAY
ncbi:MAG: carboxypeptidase-like regulatory domain-containing protein [Gemmatimonadota bacterium]